MKRASIIHDRRLCFNGCTCLDRSRPVAAYLRAIAAHALRATWPWMLAAEDL